MKTKRRKFMNQWVCLSFNNIIIKAKIIDIEFHPGLKKPLFLLESTQNNRFWLTRDELSENEIK